MCLSWAVDLAFCTWVLWMIAPVKGFIWLTVGLWTMVRHRRTYGFYRRRSAFLESKNASGSMPEAPSLTYSVHARPRRSWHTWIPGGVIGYRLRRCWLVPAPASVGR